MKFTLIYLYDKKLRDSIIPDVIGLMNSGFPADQQSFSHLIFHITPQWPSIDQLLALPCHLQCEEIEWSNGSIKTLRVRTIDVEVVKPTLFQRACKFLERTYVR